MERVVKGLYEAAVEGSVTSLINLLEKDALILERCMVTSFGETPLHIAAMLGHVEFCLDLLSRKPELAAEFDSRRSSPLHLASAKGHIDIVKALVSVKPEMCSARDCNGNNPLHVAAMKGKVGVLKELVKVQPDAARATVGRGETILHLCVQYYQVDALKFLAEDLNDEELLNARDDEGNTILHLAVADKQIEIITYLLVTTSIDVNAQNSYELTALDILARNRRDAKDLDIVDCLQQAGAQKSKEIPLPGPEFGNHNTRRLSSSTSRSRNLMIKAKKQYAESTFSSRGQKSWKHYFDKQNEWLNKQRDTLMVVAVLIATMAFQAAVSPPSGFDHSSTATMAFQPAASPPSSYDHSKGHKTEYTIFGHQVTLDYKLLDYRLFVAFNTASFISSLSIILLLISGLNFKRKMFMWILMLVMWISLSSTAMTYSISVWASSSLTQDREEHTIAVIIALAVLGWIGLMGLVFLVHTLRLIYVTIRFIFVTIWKVVRCLTCPRRRRSSSMNQNSIMV